MLPRRPPPSSQMWKLQPLWRESTFPPNLCACGELYEGFLNANPSVPSWDESCAVSLEFESLWDSTRKRPEVGGGGGGQKWAVVEQPHICLDQRPREEPGEATWRGRDPIRGVGAGGRGLD